jgi:hypothetical protein
MVIRTAQQAAILSKLGRGSGTGRLQNVSLWHRDIPVHITATSDVPDIAMHCEIDVTFDNEWKIRYAVWHHKTYVDAASPTPTIKQQYVLETIHYRTVKENYELLQEDYTDIWQAKPADIHVDIPLLRLIHGLPGSGKSKLLLWIKEYFEEVWKWEINNQFAIVAPQNAMADNVGGATLHSFGGIPFKDRRGITVNAGSFMDEDKQSLHAKKWHNLRVLLVDEIEAAGVDLLGDVEAKMHQLVPFRYEIMPGLQT